MADEVVADLIVDYEGLYSLANQLRQLQSTLKSEMKNGDDGPLTSDGTVTAESFGTDDAWIALRSFHYLAYTPLDDSIDKLEDLAGNFDFVAKTWFDSDAGFASALSQQIFQGKVNIWQGKKAQYENYLRLKDTYVEYTYYENGVKHTQKVALWQADTDGDGVADQTPPEDPGAAPTSVTSEEMGESDDVSYSTNATVDDDGRIVTETSTVTSTTGLSYTETTTYTYKDDGQVVDYTTTITHSDGTTETVTKSTADTGVYTVTTTTDDGTSTSTVTPGDNDGYSAVTVDADGNETTETVTLDAKGAGTKVVVDSSTYTTTTYTRDSSTGSWVEVSSVTDDPTEDYDYGAYY